MTDDPQLERYFTENRELWDEWTDIHAASPFYDLAAFEDGESTLREIEREALGDVSGKTLLHLQCHFGLDTLSWARLGARPTGVDFSPRAIALARRLAAKHHLPVEFHCANIYALDGIADRRFDIVFTSYGALGWLPDLGPWARAVAARLAPGGVFFFVEFHPVVWMFDSELQSIRYSYFNRGVISETAKGSYANRDEGGERRSHGWNHPISDVLGALLGVGLRLEAFAEYDYSAYNCFANMYEVAPGRWRIRGHEELPLMYSLRASRP